MNSLEGRSSICVWARNSQCNSMGFGDGGGMFDGRTLERLCNERISHVMIFVKILDASLIMARSD